MAENNDKSKKANNLKQEFVSWVKTILGAILIALFINNFIIVNAQVPTSSMENLIKPNDRIIALRLSYLFENPQRGDIAVFRFPDDEKVLYIKRIIGIPGDTIEIKNGKLYLNGEIQNEEYLKEPMYEWANWGPYNVPEGCYFMMGDNRNISEDARYWKNTYVKKEAILGKALLKYFPSIEVLMNK